MVNEPLNDLNQMEQIREDKKSNATLWIVIAIVFAAVVAVGVWWYLGLKKAEDAGKKEAVSEVAQPTETTETGTPDAEPETRTLSPDEEAFSQYFTEDLLRKQLQRDEAAWDLTMFRKLVGTAFSAEFLTEMPGMTWEKWETTRRQVLKLARSVLAEPGFLEWVWREHRDVVAAAVRTADKEERVREWAQRARPYFSGALPMSHSNILNEYYDIDKELEQELKKKEYDAERIRELTVQLDQAYRKLTEEGLDRDDIYLFEFSRRRLAEGGRDLLDVYAEILTDLDEGLAAEEASTTNADDDATE